MLDESGGVVTRTQDLSRADRFSAGRVADYHPREQSNGGGEFSHNAKLHWVQRGTMKVTPDHRNASRDWHKAPSAEEAAVASQAAKRPPVVNYPGKVSGNDSAQRAALPRDCKVSAVWKKQKTTGIPPHNGHNFRLVNVYITDIFENHGNPTEI